MDDNSKKEEFSYGYITTLCAVSGLTVSKADRPLDNQGIDITIIAPGQILGIFSPKVDAQVKCTSQNVIQGNVIKYKLPIHNYRRLISTKAQSPQILIVVVVPDKIDEWIDIDEQVTQLKKCAYWISLEGHKESTNKTNITIEIPRKNLFTPESISKIIEDAADRQEKLFGLREISDEEGE